MEDNYRIRPDLPGDSASLIRHVLMTASSSNRSFQSLIAILRGSTYSLSFQGFPSHMLQTLINMSPVSAVLVRWVGWLEGPLLSSFPVNSEAVLAQPFSHRVSGCAFLCCVVALLGRMSQEELDVFREAATLSREPH